VRKRRKLPFIEKLEITDFAAEGKSIGRHNDIVVFVPWLVPGDVADVQVIRKRKKYMEGTVVSIHKYSEDRIEPFCEHFSICGGCKWQHLNYFKQLEYKQKQVTDSLQRIGKVEVSEINQIVPSKETKYYRNKLEYTFSSTRWLTREEVEGGAEVTDRNALGFHIPGKFDRILDIRHCYLQDEFSNRLRLSLREFTLKEGFSYYNQREKTGFLRNLIVRNSNLDERMVIVIFGEESLDDINSVMYYIQDNFPEINSLNYIISLKVNDTYGDLEVINFSGKDHIIEKMEDLKFRIGPKSFFQTNSKQAYKLYDMVRSLAGIEGGEIVYDLYTGTGTIANFVARQCKKVIGIEYVEEAVLDAKVNAQLNSIDNACFFAGDTKDILTDDFILEQGKPDVVITDPPRAGMYIDVIDTLLKVLPQKIVYVSCNPATQARDIELLSGKYKVLVIQPVDMFPHTHHVENIVLLKKKNE
jgi:23S rRNA (uracil1939-C5)-methyltransferase